MTDHGLVAHLARFARALRARRVEVGIGDEIDAANALTLVDLFDRAEVRRALQIVFKIRPRDRVVFDQLFDQLWSVSTSDDELRESVVRRNTGPNLPRGRSGRED